MARLTRTAVVLALLAPAAGCWWRHHPLADLKAPRPLGDVLVQVPDAQPRILRFEDGREFVRVDQRLGFQDSDAAWEASSGALVWAQKRYYTDVCLCPPGIDTWGKLPDGKPPRCTGWLRDDDEVKRLRARFPAAKNDTLPP